MLFCAAALLAVGVPARAADEELLASAKSLYESASYEAALSEFSAIHASELADTVDTYKALCLLGLGRTREAEQALELVVTRRPLLVLNDAEYSPRVVALFRDVRKKALPAAAQQLYLAARTDYENKKYDVAATGFTQVLQIIAEIGADAQTTTLADLKELATGFATLADAKSAAPAPPPPRAAAPAPAAAATAPAACGCGDGAPAASHGGPGTCGDGCGDGCRDDTADVLHAGRCRRHAAGGGRAADPGVDVQDRVRAQPRVQRTPRRADR